MLYTSHIIIYHSFYSFFLFLWLFLDARLMFNNCRQYNEEGSEIVKDANTLERQLYLKTKEMGVATAPVGRPRKTNNVSNR